MILGLIQQDQLLGLSGELPRGSAVQLAKRFDRFRREWWWQVLVEAEEVSPLYDAWLRVSGTEAHMQQLTTHLDAVRSADRARTAEVIAWAAVALSVMALVLQLAGWLT